MTVYLLERNASGSLNRRLEITAQSKLVAISRLKRYYPSNTYEDWNGKTSFGIYKITITPTPQRRARG